VKTVAKVVKPRVSAKKVKTVAKVVKPRVSAKKDAKVAKEPIKNNIRGGTIEEMTKRIEKIKKKVKKKH
jgi:hypothetical protein